VGGGTGGGRGDPLDGRSQGTGDVDASPFVISGRMPVTAGQPGRPAQLADQRLPLGRQPGRSRLVPGPEYLEWLNRELPQAGVEIWPGSGHFPHLAQPFRFAELLAATSSWP